MAIYYSTFTGANGPLADGWETPSTASTWSGLTFFPGTAFISNNRLLLGQNAKHTAVVRPDMYAVGYFEIEIVELNKFGIIGCLEISSNIGYFYVVVPAPGNKVELARVVGGNKQTLAVSADTFAVGDRVRLVRGAAGSVKVQKNGVDAISVTDAAPLSPGRWGVFLDYVAAVLDNAEASEGGTSAPGNTAPTISAIPDVTINEDVPSGVIPITVGDAETPAADVVLSKQSSNPALVPLANIVFGGAGNNRTIQPITPAANQFGTCVVTVRVTDAGGLFSERTFTVTVNSVNDLPTISVIANQTTPFNTPTAAIPYTVGDIETPAADLIVTVTSSNQALVPNANLALGGAGVNRTIAATPAGGQSGQTTITRTVSDGVNTVSSQHVLTVNPPTANTKEIYVTWNKSLHSSGNPAWHATEYRLQRSTTADFSSGVVAFDLGDVREYADQTRAEGTTYYWRVYGKNAAGFSPPFVPAVQIVFTNA